MSQDHAVRRRTHGRSRRRIRLSSRVYLGLLMGGLEGLLAGLLGYKLMLWSAMLPPSAPPYAILLLALMLATGYGWSATHAAVRFLRQPAPRYPIFLQASLSWLLAGAALNFAGLALGGQLFSPGLWASLVASAAVLGLWRAVIYARVERMLHEGRFQIERIGLIGESAAIDRFQKLTPVWRQGGQVVTTLVLESDLASQRSDPQLIADFARTCVEQNCDHVIMIGPLGDVDAFESVLLPFRNYALDVVYAPVTADGSVAPRVVDVMSLGPSGALRFQARPLGRTGLLLKRATDIVGATIGLMLLSPLLLGAALLIRLDSPGPVLFSQQRRGFNGQCFSILKFRSMTVMEDGHSMQQARRNDPRVTRVGALLRRTSIDELPQLINVLRGEMSLVGPRPHAVAHDAEMSRKMADYAFRQRIKPGITGWAQVNGYRGETATQQAMEGRVLHDLHYVDNWSLSLDLWIVVLTLFSRRTRQNAH